MTSTTRKQAKKGGEYGVNGEWYDGGMFMPSSEDWVKGSLKSKPKSKSRKEEIAPYTYESFDGDTRAIYSFLVGRGFGLRDVEFEYNKDLKKTESCTIFLPKGYAKFIERTEGEGWSEFYLNMVDRFNAGYRTFEQSEYDTFWKNRIEWIPTDVPKSVQKELPSGFYGEIKERVKNATAKVVGINHTEGMYGTTTIVRMIVDGMTLVWFASGHKEYEIGNEYNFTGTVKAHKTHERFGDQTIMTRCKLV